MRVLVHETMTGKMVKELDFSSANYSTGICQRDDVSVDVPAWMNRELRQFKVPRKFTISVSGDDRTVFAAGVLGIPKTTVRDDGLHVLQFPGKGVPSIYERRVVLPVNNWPMVDAGGYPIESRNTAYSGLEYGTIMKRLYSQAMAHNGGNMPISFEADRVGTRSAAWEAVSGVYVQDAVDDLTALADGVEWDWVPRLDENDRLSWVFVTATDAVKEITSAYWHNWQTGGTEPDVVNLEEEISPEFMCQTAYFTGGKDLDMVMVARATGTDLIDAGIPLSEVWDSSHSSESDQATLDSWAQKRYAEGQAPIRYWSFQVRADRAPGLRHGDWCTVEVSGHDVLDDGKYARRILEVSGSSGADYLDVVVGGALSW